MPPTTDPTTPNDHRGHLAGPAPVAMWVGLLLAPAAFFTHLQAGYLLVLGDCGRDGGKWLVHGAALVAVMLAAVGVWAAWAAWVKSGRRMPGDEGTPTARTRLLAVSGLGLSIVLLLILIAQLVAGFIVPRCQ